jgi:N-methylhydantoinase A/oxoprolinase/acetone carboxylase beta subunit
LTTSPAYFIGIDTGGTYTDGVLFNPQTRTVVQSTKVLTTHQDLKLCVEQVLEELIPENPATIVSISLSTTLATNAIVEGKRKPVALLLLGYDPELVHKFQFQQQFGTKHYHFIQGRYDLNGKEQTNLDEDHIKRIVAQIQDEVDAIAICSYAGPANSSHEKRAATIIAETTQHPVVQAHHLSSELDSIRRATTASLNASLLSNLQEFLDAIQLMLTKHNIQCPIMVVQGDGSIVKAEFARLRPVEIIHSGPATSAIGGQYLADIETALVLDMGGTTTDISLVNQGTVQIQKISATVGPYHTCVKTIKARSFGLGGDSLITFDHWKNLTIEPDRVVPISRFCSQHPEIKPKLMHWLLHHHLHYSDEVEYWMLRREPKRMVGDRTIQAIIEQLREGPQRLWELKKRVGAIPPMLIRELINLEIIDRTGLTPTDLLHVTGEFSPWDTEAAALVCRMAARMWGEEPGEFVQRVRKIMTHKVVAEVIQFLSDKPLSETRFWSSSQLLDRWFFEESLTRQDPYLGCSIHLKMPIVGIGAPAKAFLPEVAEALGTTIIFPTHYEVANAVGTVVGNVFIRKEGEVFPCVEGTLITGYFSRTGSLQQQFESYEEALSFTRESLVHQVTDEISLAGAEAARVECEEKTILSGMVRLSAWAIGKPGSNGKPDSIA